MHAIYRRFVNIDYKLHLLLSIVIRLILIVYGIYHDQVSKVKYTDIDYKVFTDASRHILNGNSPYDRHTYRYSPLIAIFLIPNITLHHSFGKILFSFVDIMVAILIRLIVKNTLREYERYIEKDEKINQQKTSSKTISIKNRKKQRQLKKRAVSNSVEDKSKFDIIVDTSMFAWLYNPLTIAIGTRGNCDSLSSLLVLITLYTLQCKHQYFLTGLLHGLSIHFRLYPIIYSLTFYMYLSKFAVYSLGDRTKRNTSLKIIDLKQLKNIENTVVNSALDNKVVPYRIPERKTIFKREYLLYLIPNFNQIKLISGCFIALSCLTWIFYELYGVKFLYETYIYHFVRKDTRHNFSLYFYLLYLTAWVKNIGIWQKVLIALPQMVLLLVFSVRYGLNRFTLNFSILTQTIVMVIYNTVLTSQYFVWIMAILPLCLWQIKMPARTAIFLIVIWFTAQAAWLLPAYLLEFHGLNTFFFIWIQGVSFFCVNIAILGRLIMYFMPIKEKSL